MLVPVERTAEAEEAEPTDLVADEPGREADDILPDTDEAPVDEGLPDEMDTELPVDTERDIGRDAAAGRLEAEAIGRSVLEGRELTLREADAREDDDDAVDTLPEETLLPTPATERDGTDLTSGLMRGRSRCICPTPAYA